MIAALAPVAALLLSVAVLLMGNGLQGTLLPVRASMEAFSALDIGVLGSSYFLGFAIGCLRGPHIVQRVGHIRTFAATVAIASCVILAHAMIVNPVFWWLLRMSTGFCFAVLYMVIESWLNERSTNETRGLVFSVYTIINLTVITLGQMMLTLDEPGDFLLFSLASILVSLAAVPVALSSAQAPAPIKSVRMRLFYLYRLSPVGVMGCLTVGLANGSFWALAPVFAQGIGVDAAGGAGGRGDQMDVAGVALFMSTAVIAGAIGQWPLGRASDRIDRRKVIIAACLGAALAGTGMVLFSEAWERAALVFAFAYGLFAFPLYALSAAHMNDYVEPEGFVEAASGLLMIFAIGAVIGPVVASAAVRFWGSESLFAFTAVAHLSMAGFALYRLSRRARAPAAERGSFAEAIVVAQTVSTFDPRSDGGANPGSGAGAGEDAAAPPPSRET